MEAVVKSTQEQAVAAWMFHLRQLRISTMIEKLFLQDTNLESALNELNKAKVQIAEEIIGRNRGGTKGMHGFIAEVLEVGIGNARELIGGDAASHTWINNNKAADIIRDGVELQQKFVQNGEHWGLEAIKKHLSDYPDFVKNGGKYQIPKDFYEILETLYNMPEEQAAKLVTSDSNNPYTYKKWKWVQNFFAHIKEQDPEMGMDKIEPSLIDYNDAKANNANKTISKEKGKIRDTDSSIRDQIYEKGQPTLQEGVTATAAGALMEGGMNFCLGIAKKRKEGKHLIEFTAEDWRELGLETGMGTAKGAIRGASVYVLSNFTLTQENIATAFITAVFGIAAQANALRKGKVSSEEFLINSETLCLDVTISAIVSLLGTLAMPKTVVLGAIIGNTAGMFMYEIVKSLDLEREKKVISNHQAQINELQKKLDDQYRDFITLLEEKMKKFNSLVELAFSQEQNKAFSASIELAYFSGVADNKILKTKSEIDAFFLT